MGKKFDTFNKSIDFLIRHEKRILVVLFIIGLIGLIGLNSVDKDSFLYNFFYYDTIIGFSLFFASGAISVIVRIPYILELLNI
jgi:hypothetical protein